MERESGEEEKSGEEPCEPGKYRTTSAIPELRKAIGDKERRVRAALAAFALGRPGPIEMGG